MILKYFLTSLTLLYLAFASAVAVAGGCESVIVSADPDYPPLHWYDGQHFHGASLDVTTRVLDDLKIPYVVKYVGSLEHVLQEAATAKVDVVSTLKITPERLGYLDFSSVSVLSNPVVVFTNKSETFQYQKWNDLKGKVGLMARGNKFGQGFDEYMASQLKVEEIDSILQAFNLLLTHRAQYVLTGLYTGLSVLSLNRYDVSIIPLVTSVTETQNYIAFAKNSSCLKYKPAFDKKLEELVKSGVVPSMINKSYLEWRSSVQGGQGADK